MMGKCLVEHFATIEDPRRGRVSYDLGEMLVIVTCALFAQVETFVDIADWARTRESWFRRFLRLENGLPSHDTLNRVFRLLDPKAFESVFRCWVSDVMTTFAHVAIDGKTLRGSGKKAPVHLVSAFATDLGLVLGQQRVADKGSELAAIPELLRALELKGCLVSLDALGCQRDIAENIREQGADYLLCVKGNQPKLRQMLENAFCDIPKPPMQGNAQLGHGRQVFQIAQVIPNSGHVDPALWADCKSLGRVVSVRIEKGKPGTVEMRYYISSAVLDPDELAAAARRHWAIENGLHWYLDVMLREDACVVRQDHAPQNLSIVRRFILNLLKLDNTHAKISIRRRRNLAAWDDDERARVLGMLPL
jgi:predicted transposase YbfD/YdcC